jgi:DNA-binding transcriptional ArsR family regulator
VRTAARVFRALADPTRRQILEELRGGGELAAGEISRRFAISGPSISRHLAILKAAELVDERRDGNRILYRLVPETLITSLNAYLSAVCPTQVRQRGKIAARRA